MVRELKSKAKQKFINWLLADEDTYLPETHVGPNSLKVGSRDITDEDNSTTIYDGSAEEIGDGNQSVSTDSVDFSKSITDGETSTIAEYIDGVVSDQARLNVSVRSGVQSSAKTIYTAGGSWRLAPFCIVSGWDTNNNDSFLDLVTFSKFSNESIISSNNLRGSAATRTYETGSSGDSTLSLSLSSGNYDIRVIALEG